MPIHAFICGCAGHVLSEAEEAFIRQASPWGLILFKRNIDNPAQVLALTSRFREIMGRTDAPVLIDQEGGRVQRMGPPHWPAWPAAALYERLLGDGPAVRDWVRLGARAMAHDLAAVGINVDCMPVLDVPAPGSHQIVGDRAYSADADRVALLGRAAAEGMIAGGVLPVVKHMPGHGRARADSHHELPVVEAPLEELEAIDFKPFKILSDMPMAMSAHVVYTAVDRDRPATTSARVVSQIMRGMIGFGGLIMSDDLSMQALTGSLRERAEAAFGAGIDMGLHCNGLLGEMEQVAEATPILTGEALRRAEAALARLPKEVEPFDPVDARARLAGALALNS